ncbi:MAG: hypothetical protein K8R35_05710 [Bacteroidales bacterium]|nr:hypothetical protein [Bacteroidales bacterium]
MKYLKIKNKNKDPELISYKYLRKSLGILGFFFPVILWLGCIVFGFGPEPQSSISAYYDTIMRNVFVGFLFSIGLFLFAYEGYGNADKYAGDLACLFALGVAFCPASSDILTIRIIHLVSATLLFLTFSFFALCLFTIKDKNPTNEKISRNKIHRASGIAILICLFLLFLYFVIPGLKDSWINGLKPVFILETIMLWAFGVSWLTKGGCFCPDKSSKSL